MPGRLGGGVAAPRCCAALALTQPPPAKGLYASTRCPAETATLIEIRVFFAGYHTYRFAYLSFAYPPHIINSRIYDVGINCHKYVKYVDSRIRVLCAYVTDGQEPKPKGLRFFGQLVVRCPGGESAVGGQSFIIGAGDPPRGAES